MTFATRVVTLVSLMVAVALPAHGQAQSAGGSRTATATSRASADSVVVRASDKYGASGFHRFLFGDNYRDLWYEPIKVPVLDLGSYAGGLTALEEGGNAQTRNLHLRGKDGREYVFRPVFKEVLQLPEMFNGTVVEEIFADGLSASHPAATVMPTPLLKAAGVLHPSPQLFVMPDDARLAEFRKNFANKLGTMEEFPEDPKEGPGFGGAVDIINSDDLLEHMNKDGSHIIDAHALLTARLIDMLIGDNDRHPGQWKWAKLKDSKDALWVPIPRDRDKAFVSYEGALLKATRLFVPRMVTYTSKPQPATFYNAVDFDRRLLASLTRQDFDSTARFLMRVLSDSVIDAALAAMPPEYLKREPDIRRRFIGRRDALAASANGYYRGLFTDVDLHGTDSDDRATITRQPDGSVNIRLEAEGDKYFERRFDAQDTKGIRLYLHDGDDVATVTGVPGGIPLWIVGEKGNNTLVDSTSAGRRATRIYDHRPSGSPDAIVADPPVNGRQPADSGKAPKEKDSEGANKPAQGGDKDAKEQGGEKAEQNGPPVRGPYDPDTAWNRRPVVQFQGWEVEPFRDRGQSIKPTGGISFGRGYGIKPTIGVTRRKFGFRQYPYASKATLELSYGTESQAWGLELRTDNRFESSRMFFATENALTQLLTGRFTGFGNDAVVPEGFDDRVDQGQWYIKPAIGWALTPQTEIRFGPVVKFTNTDSTPGTFVAEDQPYGFRRFGQTGLEMHFQHESRRRVVSHGGTADELMSEDPAEGLDVEATAAFYPALWDVTSNFGTLSAVVSGFVTLKIPLRPVLAARIGGQQNFGEFPYFESAFLGGGESVRTLRRQQYAGDASLFGTLEVRVPVARFPFILPLNTGLIGFADVGRVYMDGQSPGGWHSGVGGGFWIGTMKPSTNINVTFSNSPDRRVRFTTGFVF